MMRYAKALFLPFAGMVASQAGHASWEVNMTEGVTAVSQNIYGLHMTIFLDLCRYRPDRFWGYVLLDPGSQEISRGKTS